MEDNQHLKFDLYNNCIMILQVVLSSCLEDCEVLQTVITRSQGRFESERQNVPVVDQEEDTEEGRDITDTVENKNKDDDKGPKPLS